VPPPLHAHEQAPIGLEDKWDLDQGRIVINGTQAIARVLLMQAEADRRAALETAGYVTGYRGSPLGNVDTILESIAARLAAANIIFQPGLNEDIAATALRGTQQLEAVPGARHDGVFAAWYAKGPGVDRAGDAIKHGNYAGTHRNGGVLLFYGDDHAGKSSTVAHQSEQALAASLVPSLYPCDVGELLEYGLLGFALSRYSGCWIGIKCVNEVAGQTATVELASGRRAPSVPAHARDIHIRGGALDPLGEERVVVEQRLPLVHDFIRANGVDRTAFHGRDPALGIVTAGTAFGEVRSALRLLGLDDDTAAEAGISLYKVGCIWPLEPSGLAAFASGHRTLLVVEEKKSFLEQQIASVLINRPDRPLLVGKTDEAGAPLLSSVEPLDANGIAHVIADRLMRLDRLSDRLRERRDALPTAFAPDLPAFLRRAPFFCSGCPHSRSTRVPAGSFSMTGIGCHTMANFVRPDIALLPTQMGGEGGNWIGLAPFTSTRHVFQNMGDGTYFHSGLLAIRAAVASRVNITYKILYNDAVAMTGGQAVDGPLSVARIARQVRDEGVERIIVLSDAPERHRRSGDLPEGTIVQHRDALDGVQRDLRETPGCSVLIYEQTCAAEKRRRRKRGAYPVPAKRLHIAEAVCEGCGDCSVQSSCVSLVPVETAFGRKRAIDQSSCNKDYSCVNGFCPSFITVRGAEPKKPQPVLLDEHTLETLPLPTPAPVQDAFNLMIAGIGGTGVVTVGALLGMAAHLEGKAMSSFDMTGLSQKNGAVFSHLQIAPSPSEIRSQRIGRERADLVLAFDLVAALARECIDTVKIGHTRAIANADVAPTAALQFDRDFSADAEGLLTRFRAVVGSNGVEAVDAATLSASILGDPIGANLFLVGVAAQRSLLPLGVAAIETAVRLNGVAVAFNLNAFRLGRLFAADPRQVGALATPQTSLPLTLGEVIEHRAAHLEAYQDSRLARRYRTLVERARRTETAILPGSDALALAVARTYAKLLAYKDEYEVARLLTQPELHARLAREFAPGVRISFNLAPPFLSGKGIDGRPGKREFGSWILPLLQCLAKLRRLRGTPFDPFGYSRERRMERALIEDYEQRLDRVLSVLTASNLAAVLELVELVDGIRGFGPVKEAAVVAYRARVEIAEREVRATDPHLEPMHLQ